MSSFSNERTDPRECLFRLGNNIRKTISKALTQTQQNVNNSEFMKDAVHCLEKAIDKEEDNKQLINYETLSQIHKYLQRIDTNYDLYFYQLIDECRLVLPQTRKNEELENRLAKLKCNEANKVYNSMTNGFNKMQSKTQTNDSNQISFANEFRQMRPILIAMTNAFLAIGGTFFFFYKAVEYSLSEPHISMQVLIGLIAALVVGIAEMYFLVRII